MSTSSPEANTKSASPTLSKSVSKSAKQSKVIKLKISSYLLTKWPYEESEPLPPPKPKTAPAAKAETPKPKGKPTLEKEDSKNETPNSTSNGDAESASANQDSKRKGVPGPKPGTKRSAPATATEDGTPKPKGKPGPKKRKIEGENGAPAPAPAPKLGPKANQGAINAQLRALDRTGKPCRRWGKRTVALKSFTGVRWDLPYWQTPSLRREDLSNDPQSQSSSSTEAKNEPSSSQVASDSNGGNQPTLNGTPNINGSGSFAAAYNAPRSENAVESRDPPAQQPVGT